MWSDCSGGGGRLMGVGYCRVSDDGGRLLGANCVRGEGRLLGPGRGLLGIGIEFLRAGERLLGAVARAGS